MKINSPLRKIVESLRSVAFSVTTVEGNGVNLIKLNKHTGTNSHTQSSLEVEEFKAHESRVKLKLSLCRLSVKIKNFYVYFVFSLSLRNFLLN